MECLLLAITGFGSVGMLAWGITALLPVLLHLWNRRRHQTTNWAAMEFLLAAVRKHSRRLRVEHLVLLVVRVVLLGLLALALADPFLSRDTAVGGVSVNRPSVHTLLVIDASYSMAYATDGATCFERARNAARQLLEGGSQGDGFTLIAMSDQPRSIIARPAFDRGDVESELQQLSVGDGGANLSLTLDEALRVIRDAQRDFPRLNATRVCFLSDLGETTWQSAGRPDMRAKFDTLQKIASVIVIDVGVDSHENLAVTNWQAIGPTPTKLKSVTFQATLHNFGTQDHRGQLLEFLVEDQVVAERSVDLPANAEITVNFQHRFESPRQYRVAARLGRDRLVTDNLRSLVVPVRDAIGVLLVEGTQDAANYLSLALNPTPSLPGAVRTRIIPDGALLEVDWEPYDVLFLCNIASFTDDEAAQLAQFVRSGGGLVVWLGDRVRPENYDLVLGEGAGDHRLLPARPGGTMTGDFRFDPRDYNHPITAPFRGFERSGLISVPIWKYIQCTPYATNKSRTALWVGNDPVLLDEQIGHGVVAMMSLPATGTWSGDMPSAEEWSALSVWPSFPPLVQELLALVTAGRDASRNATVGDAIGGLSLAQSSNAREIPPIMVVTLPDGETSRIPWMATGGTARWRFEETRQQGFYAARLDSPTAVPEWFAVNVDTRESSLARVAAQSLPDGIVREADAGNNVPLPLTGPAAGYSLFRWLLAGVLTLLLAECFLAHRLDQGIIG